jgi:hypothetical protein
MIFTFPFGMGLTLPFVHFTVFFAISGLSLKETIRIHAGTVKPVGVLCQRQRFYVLIIRYDRGCKRDERNITKKNPADAKSRAADFWRWA